MGVAVAPAGVVQGGTRTPGRPSTIAQAGSRRRAVLGRRTSGRSRPVCAVTGGGSGAVAAARERAQRWPGPWGCAPPTLLPRGRNVWVGRVRAAVVGPVGKCPGGGNCLTGAQSLRPDRAGECL